MTSETAKAKNMLMQELAAHAGVQCEKVLKSTVEVMSLVDAGASALLAIDATYKVLPLASASVMFLGLGAEALYDASEDVARDAQKVLCLLFYGRTKEETRSRAESMIWALETFEKLEGRKAPLPALYATVERAKQMLAERAAAAQQDAERAQQVAEAPEQEVS